MIYTATITVLETRFKPLYDDITLFLEGLVGVEHTYNHNVYTVESHIQFDEDFISELQWFITDFEYGVDYTAEV